MKLRFIAIGPSGAGKSSLINRYTHNRFCEDHELTIGVDFSTKTLTVDKQEVKVQIWDCAGHEAFRSITQTYYKNCCVALCVFDVSCNQSFTEVLSFVKDTQTLCEPFATVVLVGNKCDLKRAIPDDDLKEALESLHVPYFEVSAKRDQNVDHMFQELVKMVMVKIKNREFSPDDNVRAIEFVHDEPQYSKCCSLM